jgi:hypothetical protein
MTSTPLKPQDSILQRRTTAAADSGDPNLQILQQLKIMTIHLAAISGIRDEDSTFLPQPLAAIQQP